MKVYIDSNGNIVKVLDNVFVANSTTYDNTITYYFVNDSGIVVSNDEVSYCQISFKRADGHLISRMNAPKTNTTEGYGYKYECSQYDGILLVAGALEISAQFVKATIVQGVITERETLCTVVVEGHVKKNFGIDDEEYFNDTLEQAMLDRDTLQAQITQLATDGESYATSAAVSETLEDYVKATDLASVATSGSYADLSNKPSIPTKVTDLSDKDNYYKKTDMATVATSGSYNDLSNKPTIPTVNNGTLTIKRNGTKIKDFSANASADVTADISVPTQASDVNALPDSTKYAKSFDISINNTTYVMSFTLKDQDGTTLKTDSIDLPIESMVVNGEYDADNKKIVLTLQSGSTIKFSVADLISGLQPTITAGTGLSKSGATLNHSNAITAATKGSATAIPQITYDAQGHITGVTEKTVYPPTTAGSSNQYWRSDGSGAGSWTTPSSSPSSGSNTLISSGAVYTALQNYETTSHASSTYQTKINSSNKVSADNVDDSSTTNKFVSAADKTAIAKIGDENTANTILYRIKAIEDDISAAIDIIDDI